MRYRNRNQTQTLSYREPDTFGNNHFSRADALANAKKFKSTEYQNLIIDEMYDNFTPGYFKKAKSGELLPTQPLTVKREEAVMGYICRSAIKQISGNIYSSALDSFHGYPQIPSTFPTLISSGDIATMSQSAQARMASDGIDWATSALELGKTLSMLTGLRKSIISLISRILSSLRNRSFKSFAELYSAFSSAWLEGRFGWRILYFEIKSIYEYLDQIGEGHKKFFAREGISADRTITTQGFVKQSSYLNFSFKTTAQYKASANVGYVGVGDLSKPGGFNALNTAWEVIPFTVVLDMFFNIQDIILTWAPHASRVSGFQPGSFLTINQSVVATIEFDGGYTDGREEVVSEMFPGLITRSEIHRTVAPSHPFSFDFSPNLKGLKKVDLMAFMGPLYKAFMK